MREQDQTAIWESFAKAIDVEPREYRIVTGISGLEHSTQMLGVDERRNRLVLVASEPNARMAALIQVDVQAAMPRMKVIVARPIFFDLGVIARQIFPSDTSAQLPASKAMSFLQRLNDIPEARRGKFVNRKLQPFLPQIVRAFENVPIPTIPQIADLVQQAANLDWKNMTDAVQGNESVITFAGLRNVDNLATDRKNGICPLPLYEFDEEAWGLLAGGGHTDDIRAFLKGMGIYQFFFPPPDQLALGIVDRGLSDQKQIVRAIEAAPGIGRPFGDTELVTSHSSIAQLLEDLQSLGYVAEGEHGVEITPSGTTTRSAIKFRPRESLLQKLLNRFSMNLSISPKDFLPPHG